MAARANKRPRQSANTPRRERGNFVSEWYGHRMYPIVASGRQALADQKRSRCPFLSQATAQDTTCVKPANSTGVCTISSSSNGPRQDWIVCPHRVLGSPLLDDAATRLFGVRHDRRLRTFAAPTLARGEMQSAINRMLRNGDCVVVYLRSRLGGEISVSQTDRSPEFSFDITMIEVTLESGAPKLGRFGVLEVQTMDFHGTYQKAVQNLQHALRYALRLHDRKFHAMVGTNQRWLSDRVEGPNIANVFKRTFYQMLLKFQIGADESSAGCVLALPAAVWDSWQRHLGRPQLEIRDDGASSLLKPGVHLPARVPAWIFVFDINAAMDPSPNQIVLNRVIATDAESFAYFATRVAPEAAITKHGAAATVLLTIRRRLRAYWPELLRDVSTQSRRVR